MENTNLILFMKKTIRLYLALTDKKYDRNVPKEFWLNKFLTIIIKDFIRSDSPN